MMLEQRRAIEDGALLIDEARRVARRLLRDDEERWQHSEAVAARAASLAQTVPEAERTLLVASAWLHDVGYASSLTDTAFHPLDGARYLRSAGWYPPLCDLVAHHSGSRFVAHVRGLDGALADFRFAEDSVSDALTIADQTIGPNGRPLTLEARMRDMLDRHGPDSPSGRAHPARARYFRAAHQRVLNRLHHATVDDRAGRRALV